MSRIRDRPGHGDPYSPGGAHGPPAGWLGCHRSRRRQDGPKAVYTWREMMPCPMSSPPQGETIAGGQRCLLALAGQRDGHQGMRACLQRLLIISRDYRREITAAICVARLTGVDHEGIRPARVLPGRTRARARIESNQSPEPELFHRGHSLADRDRPLKRAGSRRNGQLWASTLRRHLATVFPIRPA